MSSADYVSATDIKQILSINISSAALRKWTDAGYIRVIRAGKAGKRFYHQQDVRKYLGFDSQSSPQHGIIYARVKHRSFHSDLLKQVRLLQARFPDHQLITDYASATNFRRKGLKKMLQHVFQGGINQVVVTHPNIICSYGYELIEWILRKHNTELVVLGEEDKGQSEELGQSVIDICTELLSKYRGRAKDQKNTVKAIESSKKEVKSGNSGDPAVIQQVRGTVAEVEGESGGTKEANEKKFTLIFSKPQ